MRRGLLIALTAGLVLAQIGLVPAIRPFGVVPNLVMLAIILIGLLASVSVALWFALACGLVLDIAAGTSFGTQTGLLVLAGLSTGLIHRTGLAADGLLAPVLLVVGAAAVSNIVMAVGLTPVSGFGVIVPAIRIFVCELILMLAALVPLKALITALVPKAPLNLGAVRP